MNYLLTHINSPLPQHLLHCLRQIIFTDPESKITLCTDTSVKFDDSRVEVVHYKDLSIPETGDYYRNEVDPLWLSSLLRIFIINSYLKATKKDIVHFDNDVLLLKNPTAIVDGLDCNVYMTQQTDNTFIFGFSIIKNIEKFDQISNSIYNNVIKGLPYILSQTGDHGHEMRLLYHYGREYITNLPTHPTQGTISNIIFDPITYGQFLGGTNNGHPPGFIDKDHIVGKILDPESIKFHENKPTVNGVELVNLHVHGKCLERFTTYDK